MAITPCPNPNPECPWFNRCPPKELQGTQEHGCFSDRDHIIPQYLGRQATGKLRRILRQFIQLPENSQQLCRWEHDEKSVHELVEPPSIPSIEIMKMAIIEERNKRILNGQI